MRKTVEFCDLCHADGIYHLAAVRYCNDEGERLVACRSCKRLVDEVGLDTFPLELPYECFLEDVKDGLEADEQQRQQAREA